MGEEQQKIPKVGDGLLFAFDKDEKLAAIEVPVIVHMLHIGDVEVGIRPGQLKLAGIACVASIHVSSASGGRNNRYVRV